MRKKALIMTQIGEKLTFETVAKALQTTFGQQSVPKEKGIKYLNEGDWEDVEQTDHEVYWESETGEYD